MHDVLWSLWRPGSSSCPRRAVRIGFGSIICLFCVLLPIPLSMKVYACYRLDSSGLNWAHVGSSGLIWAHLGSSKLIWAHLGPLGSSVLSWAHLCSSGLLEARLGSPGLIRSTSPASRSSTSQQPISENQGYYHLLPMSSGKLPFTPAHSTHGRRVWIPETGGCS